MKRAVFLTAIMVFMFCIGMMQVVNAATPSWKVGMYVLSWNFSELSATTIASSFDMSQSWFVTGSNDYTLKMNTVKSLNPNYKALVYMNLHTIPTSDPDYNLVKANGWLVKDASGNYIPGGYSSSLYILDVGNPAYQQWQAAKIKSYLTTCPYFDGVMGDGGIITNAVEFRSWGTQIPINPRTNAPFTNADVINGYLGLHTAIKNAIGSKLLMTNGIWDGQLFYDNYNAYADFLSRSPMNVVGSEGCWYQGSQFMTETDWLKSQNFVAWIQDNWLKNHPERFLDTTCGSGPQWTMPSGATREQMMLYGFCSTMLAVNYPSQTSMDFSFNTAQSPVPASSMQLEQKLHGLDIGQPLASYYVVQSHVYTRDFTNGKIMVNPTSTSYTVTLTSTYRTLDGTLVNSVNIQPHTGVILYSTTPVTTGTLSIIAASGGTTTPAAGTYTFSLGGSTQVLATPASGYTLTGWIFNGAPYQTGSPQNPLTVGIFQAAETIQPVFTATAPPTTGTLSIIAASGGTTTPAAGTYTFSLGGSTQVLATPASGYTLTGWIFNGAPYQTGSPQNPLTVGIFQAAETIQPVFTATAPTSTVFSDGFESGSLKNWTFAGPDQWNGAGCTLALQSGIVHNGSYAVRMTTPGIAQNEGAECAKDLNLSEFSLSFYAKIVSWDQRLGSSLYLAWAYGSNGYQSYLCYASLMHNWDGTYRWRLIIRTGPSTEATYLSAPITIDSNWHSIRLHWKKDATQGFAELLVDGVKVVATPYVNTSTSGNAARLLVGLAVNSASAGVGSKADVAIDDVAVTIP